MLKPVNLIIWEDKKRTTNHILHIAHGLELQVSGILKRTLEKTAQVGPSFPTFQSADFPVTVFSIHNSVHVAAVNRRQCDFMFVKTGNDLETDTKQNTPLLP